MSPSVAWQEHVRRRAVSPACATCGASMDLRKWQHSVCEPCRFWARVRVAGLLDCWTWVGGADRRGYGRVTFDRKTHQAYRYAYELMVGPVPVGLELDHLCRVPACVNPAHLEPVTHTENVRRGGPFNRPAFCRNGHPMVEGNLYVKRATGTRQCRTCSRARYRAKRTAA